MEFENVTSVESLVKLRSGPHSPQVVSHRESNSNICDKLGPRSTHRARPMLGGLRRSHSSFFAFIENEVLSVESVMVYKCLNIPTQSNYNEILQELQEILQELLIHTKLRHCINGPQSLLDNVLQRCDGVIDFVTF